MITMGLCGPKFIKKTIFHYKSITPIPIRYSMKFCKSLHWIQNFKLQRAKQYAEVFSNLSLSKLISKKICI